MFPCYVKQKVIIISVGLPDSLLVAHLEAGTDRLALDVICIAPVPLYNSFADVFRFAEILKDCLK